jgi:hypothetical protein
MYCCRMYYGGMTHALTRLTVNLVPKAEAALDKAVELSGDSKTDTVNRAIQAYAYFLKVKQDGGAVYVREHAGAERFQVEFL